MLAWMLGCSMSCVWVQNGCMLTEGRGVRGQRLVAMREGRESSLCERAEAHRCVRGQRVVEV